MASLLLYLEDFVLADYGAAELAAVRGHVDRVPGAADLPLHLRVKLFLEVLARVQRREFQPVYNWAGVKLTERVIREHPAMLRGNMSTRTILLQLNQLICTCLNEWLPEAPCPDFYQDFLDGATIRVGFDGPVEVAWLLEGMATAFAAHFGEQVQTNRADAPANLPERQLLDVKVVPDRRGSRLRPGLSPVAALR